jgi:NOL1/NOP2/fmu family ribosome biogenesis protein
LQRWIRDDAGISFFKWQDQIIALPEMMKHEVAELSSFLYLKKAGVNMGKWIREELVPSHELAMSTIISDELPAISVDRQTALQYLRMETLDLHLSEKGWMLIRYGQLPLGFVKSVPGRLNNHYPREWRILNK